MNRFAWTVYNQTTATDQTANVMSFNMTVGRRAYLDNYSGGSLVLTIKNQSNESAGFSVYNEIRLKRSDGARFYSFWVSSVDYSDYPGNIGVSTATVTCQDLFGILGRTQFNNFSISETNIGNAWTGLQAAPGLNSSVQMTAQNPASITAAQTVSGSVLNTANLLVTTERGLVRQALIGMADSTNRFELYGRNDFKNWATSSYGFTRTTGASSIAYQQFDRIGLGLDFMNQVQVTGPSLATQQATNAASVTAYGAAGFTVSSYDYSTGQALGHAQWLANMLSDPAKLRFAVTFTDIQQSTTTATFNTFLENLTDRKTFNLTYRVPGAGSDTTLQTIMEGMSISADPGQSTFTVYLSALVFYQFFTLNSTTNGVLDTSRLSWSA